MSIEEAKHWLADRYVLHPAYRPADHPHHSNYARVDLAVTFMRVRHRMRQTEHTRQGIRLEPSGRSDNQLSDSSAHRAVSNSFSGAVEQVRQRLRMVHGRVA